MTQPETQTTYYRNLVEALLFVSPEPLKLSQIASSLKIEKSMARNLIDELILDYSEKDGGIILREIANGYELVTNPKFHEDLSKIFKEKKRETFSKGTIDTLAIIAYKQPITLSEIDEIRGVSSRAIVANLVSKKLLKPVGHKEVPGKPTLFGTTNEFLIHFGLSKLSDLPHPSEVKELNFENLSDLNFTGDRDIHLSEENYPKAEDIFVETKELKIDEGLFAQEEIVTSQDFTNENNDAITKEEIVTSQDFTNENNDAITKEEIVTSQDFTNENNDATAKEEIVTSQDFTNENNDAITKEEIVTSQDFTNENNNATTKEEIVTSQDFTNENNDATAKEEIVTSQVDREENDLWIILEEDKQTEDTEDEEDFSGIEISDNTISSDFL
jgi:segregation and condensation protein B